MWATNTAARTSPAASTGQVRDGGHRGASVSAVHTSPTAHSTRTAPTPSMRQPGRLPARAPPGPLPGRGKIGTAAARTAKMTGRLIRKIQRQLNSTSSPPSTGPLPAATAPTAAQTPTAVLALACREHRQREPQCGGHQHSRPCRLHRPAADQRWQARGQRASQRRDAEHHQAGQEARPGARCCRRPARRAAAVWPRRWRTHRGSTRHPAASQGRSRAAAPAARC